jgi:cytochrome c5
VSSSQEQDKSFFVTAAIVFGALFAFTFTIIVAAKLLGDSGSQDPAAAKQVADRIAPIGTVITDPAALLKVSAAAPHAPMSGDQIVTQVCSACHGSGVLGAPKIGDKANWGARFKEAGGLDGLAKVAESGKGSMPPRGGNPALSNDEIKSAIQQMLKQTGV